MAMFKTIRKAGNSHVLPIDKSVMELMDITTETQLKIELDGRTLIVKPMDDARFEAALEKAAQRFPKAMKRLAK